MAYIKQTLIKLVDNKKLTNKTLIIKYHEFKFNRP
jgi:hypothetical protein